MTQWRDQISYYDELLSDQSLHRIYNHGIHEWRRELPDRRVEWQDSQGQRGVDELLGGGIVKRVYADGRAIYGREQGYGRTAWSDDTLTVNRSSFGGQVGAILAGLGAGFLLRSITPPPAYLGPEEEEALRRAQASEQGGGYVVFESSGDSGPSVTSTNRSPEAAMSEADVESGGDTGREDDQADDDAAAGEADGDFGDDGDGGDDGDFG